MTAPTSPGVVPADVETDLDCIRWYVECLDAVAFQRRPVMGLAEAEGGYKAAMQRIADRANRPSLTEDERDVSPPDDVTETEVRERAWKVIRDCGWTNGNRVGLHSVVELMVRLGMDLTRNPAADRCIYPDCGCDFDAVCETGRLRALADRSEPRQEKEGNGNA